MNRGPQQSRPISDVVDEQIKAYNNRDIEAFAATYHDSVELYLFPDECFCRGKKDLREQYTARFKARPEARAAISNRIIMGSYVIDDETVIGLPTVGSMRLLAKYEVIDDLIARVWFTYEVPSKKFKVQGA